MSEIKDGIYSYISGTVGERVTTSAGSSFKLAVKIHPNSMYPDQITVWDAVDLNGEPAVVHEGDRVTMRGWFSWTRAQNPEDRPFALYALRASKLHRIERHEDRDRSGVVQTANDETEVPF